MIKLQGSGPEQISPKTDSALLYGLEGNTIHLKITIQFLPALILTPINMNLPKEYTVDQVKKTIWRNTPALQKHNSDDYYIAYNNLRENKLKIEFIRFTKAHPQITKAVESEEFIQIGVFPMSILSSLIFIVLFQPISFTASFFFYFLS